MKEYDVFGIIMLGFILFFVIFVLPVLMISFDDCITARAGDSHYDTSFNIVDETYCCGEIIIIE